MITTITNHKGGTGKTTFLQNLAIMYALNKKKVLVIDLDTKKNLSFCHITNHLTIQSPYESPNKPSSLQESPYTADTTSLNFERHVPNRHSQ